jgi:hypothetical protein
LLDCTRADALLLQIFRREKSVYTCLNNRPSMHNRVIANADATFNNASSTNVDVSTYVDFASSLCALASL